MFFFLTVGNEEFEELDCLLIDFWFSPAPYWTELANFVGIDIWPLLGGLLHYIWRRLQLSLNLTGHKMYAGLILLLNLQMESHQQIQE